MLSFSSRKCQRCCDCGFFSKEVKQAVFGMGICKALSSNGFEACFYQKSRNLVGPHVIDMVLKLLQNGIMDEKLEEISIRLIPKVEALEIISQF